MIFQLVFLILAANSLSVLVNDLCPNIADVADLSEKKTENTHWVVIYHLPASEVLNVKTINKCSTFYEKSYQMSGEISEYFLDSYDYVNNYIVLVRNRALVWYDYHLVRIQFFNDPQGSHLKPCNQPEQNYQKMFWKYDDPKYWFVIYKLDYMILFHCETETQRTSKQNLLVLAKDVNPSLEVFPEELIKVFEVLRVDVDLLIRDDSWGNQTKFCKNIIDNCRNGRENLDIDE